MLCKQLLLCTDLFVIFIALWAFSIHCGHTFVGLGDTEGCLFLTTKYKTQKPKDTLFAGSANI